jgi:hypothetical protein
MCRRFTVLSDGAKGQNPKRPMTHRPKEHQVSDKHVMVRHVRIRLLFNKRIWSSRLMTWWKNGEDAAKVTRHEENAGRIQRFTAPAAAAAMPSNSAQACGNSVGCSAARSKALGFLRRMSFQCGK